MCPEKENMHRIKTPRTKPPTYPVCSRQRGVDTGDGFGLRVALVSSPLPTDIPIRLHFRNHRAAAGVRIDVYGNEL